MPGFGRKNARETLLRAIMIHTAIEVLSKESDPSHVLFSQDLNNILASVIREQEVELSASEFRYVIAARDAMAAVPFGM